MNQADSLEIERLHSAYRAGELTPAQLITDVYRRIEARGLSPIWIELVPEERALAYLNAAAARRAAGQSLPLFGIPFAIKDNIDLGGARTTAACPAFGYIAERDATAVARLIAAGAIPIGKTNLDQFATGLVGVRSPFGAGSCAFDARYISGGSSSGSALAVAHGLVSFALGTDTAGSGRVPAGFNNLVGVKPTPGLVSTRGVVPACRSLDCVSVFGLTVRDAELVLEVMAGFDAEDSFSRARPEMEGPPITRVGVPRKLEFFGDAEYERCFREAVGRVQALGIEVMPFDLEPFLETALLLYGGPWVAERYAAVGAFIEAHPSETHPVVREIVLGGKQVTGAQAFEGVYKLSALRRATEGVWKTLDALLLPTAGTHYTIEAVEREPVELNSRLGRYTNFVNLLDLAGIAVPSGFTEAGLPFGVTLLGPAFTDARLGRLGDRLQQAAGLPLGATQVPLRPHAEDAPPSVAAHVGEVLLAVAGAHLSGQPLNHQLTSRQARLVQTTRTAPGYRLYALDGTVPPKPGLVREPGFAGPGIEVEVWSLGREAFGSFVAEVPPPMVIGTVELADGSSAKGFLCEPFAIAQSPEITALGAWRAFLNTTHATKR
jgi:allophanate hydrolase